MKIQRDYFFAFQLTDFDMCVCLNSHDLLSHTRWPMSPLMTHTIYNAATGMTLKSMNIKYSQREKKNEDEQKRFMKNAF